MQRCPSAQGRMESRWPVPRPRQRSRHRPKPVFRLRLRKPCSRQEFAWPAQPLQTLSLIHI
eukprot:13042879-Alexandrium_andersonii.AAC.1